MASTQQSLFPVPAEKPAESSAPLRLPQLPEPGSRRPRLQPLWLAVELPMLSLESCFRASVNEQPPERARAIIETRGKQATIHACDAAAIAAGVRCGMSLAAAWALCPQLDIHELEPRRQAAMLRRLATWCGQFTPVVVIDDTTLLLEIRGSLALFGGARRLERCLREGMAELGFKCHTAIAPTPRAASWFARAGGGQCVLELDQLVAELGRLPLACTGFSERLLQRFEGIGARHVAELLRLPRDGLARRFGAGTLAILDQATGRAPDVREAVTPPPRFHADLDLNYEIEAAAVLLHPARILLREFSGYLLATQQGVLRWRLDLVDRDKGVTPVLVAHGEAIRDMSRLERVLEQKLENIVLPAPIQRLRLQALRMESSTGRARELFRDAAEASRWEELVECLRARLGEAAVEAMEMLPDHRPEFAMRAAEPGMERRFDALQAARPLWLLPEPQRLDARRAGPACMTLLEGPERIETGWWDGTDVRRDYWHARDRDGRLAWIFRDQRDGDWWLHGYFQ